MINYEDVMREKQRLQDEKLNDEKAKLEKEQKEKQITLNMMEAIRKFPDLAKKTGKKPQTQQLYCGKTLFGYSFKPITVWQIAEDDDGPICGLRKYCSVIKSEMGLDKPKGANIRIVTMAGYISLFIDERGAFYVLFHAEDGKKYYNGVYPVDAFDAAQALGRHGDGSVEAAEKFVISLLTREQ